MKKLIAISILCTLLVGCTEPTFENECRGDIIHDNLECFKVYTEHLKHQSDSLNYELKLLQQKFHYECNDRK